MNNDTKHEAQGLESQQSAPAGYVMVPVEPNEALLDAMWNNVQLEPTDNQLKVLYKAILAAAPKAECQPVSDDALPPLIKTLRDNGDLIAGNVTEAQFREVLVINAALRGEVEKLKQDCRNYLHEVEQLKAQPAADCGLEVVGYIEYRKSGVSISLDYGDEPLIRKSDADARDAMRLERIAELEAQYQRDVYGLNNEGDPIGGDPAGGYANDNARLRAELGALDVQEPLGYTSPGMIQIIRNLPNTGRIGICAKRTERYSEAVYAAPIKQEVVK